MNTVKIRFKQFWHKYQWWLQTILMVTIIIFVVTTFQRHWEEVTTIHVTTQGWLYLSFSTIIMLISYIWTGQVWGFILRALGYPVTSGWAISTFLLTNLIKYLPSNLLHLYGRTLAAQKIGVSMQAASISVILDSMLVIASGWILGLFSIPRQGLLTVGIVLSLVVILLVIHPRIFGFFLQRLKLSLPSSNSTEEVSLSLAKYPLDLLLGQLGYVLLRGIGFILTIYALIHVPVVQIPQMISIYSIAWLLGYVTPGAPGGIGVYEATLIELLQRTTNLGEGHILAAVAFSRVIGIVAEIIGAGVVWLNRQFIRTS